jgi:cyclophilin family peptidyl-prolyl cis-trans isomerase
MASLRMYLEDTYGEDIRSVFRHFALSYHDKAAITAEAAEAAGAQGKFWEMHDLLFERQQEWNPLPVDEVEARLVEYAEELGLDTELFSQELSDHVYLDKVNADTEGAVQAGLPGTPSYVVNGVVYPTQELGLHPVTIGAFVRLLSLAPDQYTGVPSQVIDPDKKYTATIRTGKGDIVAELFADLAPTNVNGFVFLAEDGWYDGQAFFHVEPGFVAQSGDPTSIGWGIPFPGYYCGDEISPDLTFDEAGMLALFAPSPGRNSSQFFITYAPQPDFNGRYTIIGRVVEGMDVAESLTPTQPGPDQPAPDVIEMIVIEEG